MTVPALGGRISFRHLPQQTVERILTLNGNPRTRAAASRKLNRLAHTVVDEARAIAATEFRTDRPQERRPPESREHGAHYVDSFEIKPNTAEGINRLTIRWGNSHPAARIIENGARPHIIAAGERFASGTGPYTTSGKLVFPYRPPPRSQLAHSPGGPAGQWPVDFASGRRGGGRTAVVAQVNHPGSPAFHIFRRAIRRLQDRERNSGSRRRRR